MIRPFRSETERYGEYSKAGEFVYDHPFLWGSKRTGPDLQREGGKYPDSWHWDHMMDPTQTSAGSVMPSYGWLYEHNTDVESIPGKIKAMRTLGVPYPEGFENEAIANAVSQEKKIVASLAADKVKANPDKEIVPGITIINGDAISLPIAAASILAKEAHDRWVKETITPELHLRYGLGTNMGYGTPIHMAGLKKWGADVLHRRSFAPVHSVSGLFSS
jgi:hypothetical protein